MKKSLQLGIAFAFLVACVVAYDTRVNAQTTVDLGVPPSTSRTTGSGSPASASQSTDAASPPSVSQSTNTGSNTFYLSNPLDQSKFNSVGGLIQNVLVISTYVAILVAVLLLIWVGFQFVLSRGNTDRMKELKNWLLWIVVGVAIVIGARIIVSVVINTLDASGVVSPNVIQSANNALGGN